MIVSMQLRALGVCRNISKGALALHNVFSEKFSSPSSPNALCNVPYYDDAEHRHL